MRHLKVWFHKLSLSDNQKKSRDKSLSFEKKVQFDKSSVPARWFIVIITQRGRENTPKNVITETNDLINVKR